MKVIVDTNALIWDTVDPDKITPAASKALIGSKVLFLPTIVLLEFEWTLRKLNQLAKLAIVTNAIEKQQKYFVYPLDHQVFNEYLLVDKSLEMHDRIIVATAKLLRVSIITNDPEIKKVYSKVIW